MNGLFGHWRAPEGPTSQAPSRSYPTALALGCILSTAPQMLTAPPGLIWRGASPPASAFYCHQHLSAPYQCEAHGTGLAPQCAEPCEALLRGCHPPRGLGGGFAPFQRSSSLLHLSASPEMAWRGVSPPFQRSLGFIPPACLPPNPKNQTGKETERFHPSSPNVSHYSLHLFTPYQDGSGRGLRPTQKSKVQRFAAV